MEVRRGELGDISSVLWLLNVMQTEAEKNQIDWFKVSHTLIECIRQGLVLICLNKEGQAVGSIGGATTSEWYSQELLLGDYWFFVHPDFRNSPAAFKLMKAWKEIGEQSGMTIKAGHTLGSDIEGKDKLFTKLGFTKTGSLFERVPDGRSLST